MKRILICTFLLAGLASVNATTYSVPDPPTAIELTFVDHLKAGLIEQDVYIEKVPGSGQVYRVLPSERDLYLDHQVYGLLEEQHHDPFDAAQAGPYQKGSALGMTLREWLSAKGRATFTCEEGWATFKASFENLVPNSTYTLWHFFMPAPPTVPFTGTLDVPVGDRKGKQSVFKTDAKGNASIELRFEHCLQLSGDQLMSGIAIALHSDSKTYGTAPGAFGKVSHVQLFAMLPSVDDFE